MALGHPMHPLALGNNGVQQLHSIANSCSLPCSIMQQAQIVLARGSGETNPTIANRNATADAILANL